MSSIVGFGFGFAMIWCCVSSTITNFTESDRISKYGFESISNFVRSRQRFPNYKSLKDGDIVFIDLFSVQRFAQESHRITTYFILITGGGDDSVPGVHSESSIRTILVHDKLIHWYSFQRKKRIQLNKFQH